jgi:hypothetical protein
MVEGRKASHEPLDVLDIPDLVYFRGLVHRVFGLGRFFLSWLPSVSLEESLPLWAHMP